MDIIVREALERICLVLHKQGTVRQAATALLELARQTDTPAPQEYRKWEEEYARVKWSGHDG